MLLCVCWELRGREREKRREKRRERERDERRIHVSEKKRKKKS